MVECDQPGDKLVCGNCGRDTFAIRRENGLEVKYRDRWILVLNDAVGTVLFRCRSCGNTSVYHLNYGIATDDKAD
jgi:ribosomal protein L37E